MRISIPLLAAAALIVAGCGSVTTGAGAGSGGATDGGSGAGTGSDAGSGSGGGSADGGSGSGPGDSAPDGGGGSGGPATHALRVEISGSGNANGSVESQPAGIACGPSCSATFADGTDVVLTASAASGSTFKAWDGACSGSTTTCTIHLTGDAQVTAEFQKAATQDECAGLAPGDPGEPVRLQATDVGDSCGIGTSDGSGNVAATITSDANTTIVRLFDRSGGSLGRFAYDFGPLFEQLAGFVGTSTPPGLQLMNSDAFAIDPHGNEIGRDSPGTVLAAAEDPTGGMVVFSLAQGNVGNVLSAYDGRAQLRWRVALAKGIRGAGGGITLGVDRLGNTLVLIAEDAVEEVRAQWVDHDGHAGPQFIPTVDLGGDPVNSTLVLVPRIGDGLFLEEKSPQRPGWLAQFDSLATAALTPPSWLSSRPLAEAVHMARGGLAYAFLSSRVSACAQQIEIVAPSGKTCGTARFPLPNCTTGAINVGYDGTVIQASPFGIGGRNGDGTATCTWQSWPGFLH